MFSSILFFTNSEFLLKLGKKISSAFQFKGIFAFLSEYVYVCVCGGVYGVCMCVCVVYAVCM